MNCPDLQIISEFADGELEPNQAAEVERHVAQCPSCQQSLGEMQSLEQRGRAALKAIPVEETAIRKVVYLNPFWVNWLHPIPLTAAAAAVAIFIGACWVTPGFLGSHQTAPTPHQVADASNTATSSGASDNSDESEDAAFAQWLEPYRNLNIPLVPMEVAANYDPAPIPPFRPENVERN